MRIFIYNNTPEEYYRKFIEKGQFKNRHFVLFLSHAGKIQKTRVSNQEQYVDDEEENVIYCPLCGSVLFKSTSDVDALLVGESIPLYSDMVEYSCGYCHGKYKVV